MRYGDIRFYDEAFHILAIFPQYLSVNWQLYFSRYGTVEIHMEKCAETVALLTKHKYLFLVQDDRQAVVTGVQIGTDCAVFGRTPEWLLTKFLLTEFSAAEAVQQGALSAACGSKLACLAVQMGLKSVCSITTEAPDVDETDRSSYQIDSAKSVYDIVTDCLTEQHFGFSLRFDVQTGGFSFCVLCAKQNDAAVFAEELKTAYDSTYTFDLQNEASGGVYYHKLTNMGKWDPVTNQPLLTVDPVHYGTYYLVSADGTRFGLELHQGDYLVCKDQSGDFTVEQTVEPFLITIAAEENGIFTWSAVLQAEEEDGAAQCLNENRAEQSISCKSKDLTFGEDFFLGDLVKTEFSAGDFSFAETKLIVGVHIWDDADDFGCLPTAEQFTQQDKTQI